MNADDVIRILNELCNKLGIAIDWSVDNEAVESTVLGRVGAAAGRRTPPWA